MAGHAGDAEHVLVGLAGQADHEVQLEPGEPALERGPHGLVELRLVHALVDRVAQRLGARLGRERQRAALVGGEPGEALRRRVDAQRRQRHAQAGAQLADARERLRDAAVVARAQREQRDLVAAGLVEQPVGGLDHEVDRPLPHRPVPHARLAEAAAGGAAAHDLDDDAVVDRLEHRDDRAAARAGSPRTP